MSAISNFNIYPMAVENAVVSANEVLAFLNLTNIEIQSFWKHVDEYLSETGSFSDITNSIIYAIFYTIKTLILDKFPEADVEYFINCNDSHLYINEKSF